MLLTRNNLQQYFYNNIEIQSVFHHKDPNHIAETIINQMDIIINSIAPSKKIQCKKNYVKWLNNDIKKQGNIKNLAHKQAKL